MGGEGQQTVNLWRQEADVTPLSRRRPRQALCGTDKRSRARNTITVICFLPPSVSPPSLCLPSPCSPASTSVVFDWLWAITASLMKFNLFPLSLIMRLGLPWLISLRCYCSSHMSAFLSFFLPFFLCKYNFFNKIVWCCRSSGLISLV